MPRRQAATKRVRSVATQAKAVMKAFRSAKSSAPRFMSTCGIFPEVSESATDRLHSIVHELGMRQLNKGRHLRALQRRVKQLTSLPATGLAKGRKAKQSAAEIAEGISSDLTELLACEAIAAYLFGLSVGMTVRTLPERLDR